MINNYLYGTTFATPYVDISNIYGGDGYFPERSGMLGKPNMRGQLLGDSLELTSQKDKDKRGWRKLLKLTGIVVGSILGYKLLKGPVTKLFGGIKNLFKGKTPTLPTS